MPTLRKRMTRRPLEVNITPELVELFRRAEQLRAVGDDQVLEEDGGRRREYLDIKQKLHTGLGLRPWHESPLDILSDAGPPVWDLGAWETARRLRRALIERL